MRDFKEDFQEWKVKIYNKGDRVTLGIDDSEFNYYGYSVFNELPKAMQFGVYQDFFDSVGIVIDIVNDGTCIFRYNIDGYFHPRVRLIRPEARKQALAKAIELYEKL